MELNEAIRHDKEVAKNWKSELVNCVSEEGRNTCLKRAAEHEQRAEWLTELAERREADRWISVKDKLPEEKINPNTEDLEEVLCSTIWGDVRAYKFGKPIHFDKPHFWYACGIMDKYVTHWQYLPEPYKKGGAE